MELKEITITMEQNYKPLLAFTTFNQLDMTRKCLEYAQDLGYPILVIDDCSTDGTQEYLSQIRVDAIFKSERKGLTDSWNRAYKYFKASDHSHLGLCNNDVLIPKGAIEGMLSDYPLVVPMCNESGAGYACKEQNFSNYHNELGVHKDKNVQLIQDSIVITDLIIPAKCWTGFCMCMHRDITKYELPDGNLFNPKNINTGNDDDLARRVQAYIALGSFVYHFKGVSFNNKISGRNDLSRDYK